MVSAVCDLLINPLIVTSDFICLMINKHTVESEKECHHNPTTTKLQPDLTVLETDSSPDFELEELLRTKRIMLSPEFLS